METMLFCVFDGAANRYLDPFNAPTPEVAMRGFRSVVNQPEHQFNKFPADYTLFMIGKFDPETGLLLPQTPANLGNAVSFLDHGEQLPLTIDKASNDG